MKMINKLSGLTLLLLIGISILSCNKNKFSSFEEVIEHGGSFSEPEFSEDSEPGESYTETIDDVVWKCTTETVSIQDAAGGNDGFPLFSPNSNVIYPGNLLQGKSLSQGTPDLIAVDRAGGVISTDVVDGNIQSSFEVDAVSKGEVTQAINNIIEGSTGVIPANFNLSIKNVQSREQFALALGLNVNTTFVDVESKLNYDSSSSKSSFIVNLNQSFYTMSFDIPTSYDRIFAPNVTPEDLVKYVGPGNPACYVSDVTYGRIYYMMIQSSSSQTAMSAAINGSFNGLVNSVDGSVDVSYMSSLKDLSISIYAYGGASSSTLQTIGVTDLGYLADLLSESSDIRSGKPISYVVRSVYDNQIVSTQLATQYDVKNCKPTGPNSAPPYTEHWAGEVVSKMGPVGAAFSTSGTQFVLINKESTQFMISNIGKLEGPFPISDLVGGEMPFKIGAACNIDGNIYGPQNSGTIQLFDQSGVLYHYLFWNSRKLMGGEPRPIEQMSSGGPSNPFNGVGIGAVAYRWYDTDGPSSRYLFNKAGKNYAHFNNNPIYFSTVYDLYNWGPDYSVTDRIDAVGAAIGFDIGENHYYILIDEKGTEYVYYGLINGVTQTIGPFDL